MTKNKAKCIGGGAFRTPSDYGKDSNDSWWEGSSSGVHYFRAFPVVRK